MYRIEKFGLSANDAGAIIRGVALGEYSLLLGAGFSLGAKNGAGQKLPTSLGLAEELKKAFSLSLEIEGPNSLPLAYEDAVYVGGEEKVFKFLKNHLTNCVPSWQGVIAELDWQRIWTLNIDDILTSVFRDKLIREFDFSDSYRVKNREDGLQVIYLHGRAVKPNKKVFSIQEYHDAIRGAGDWHTAFFTEFKERPFIVCGASLVGEVDLARSLRAKNQSRITTGLPSVAVIKDLQEASADRLRDRLGLFPISATGEDFFSNLFADAREFLKENPSILPSSLDPNIARIFNQQFQQLELDKQGQVQPRQDFYSGDQPLWSDIVADKDAVLSFGRAVTEEVKSKIDSGISITGIFGDAGCGKSTTLLRVARELTAFPVYLFRGYDDVDVDACIEYAATRPTVLLFDDAADISISIGKIASAAKDRELKLAIVFADRTKRKKGMLTNFLADRAVLALDHSAITPRDALAVIEKRRSATRLGAFGKASNTELRKIFVEKHHGSLLSALTEIDLGKGFDERIAELTEAITKNEQLIALVLAVAQTHRWGYPLPLHFATGATGLATDIIVQNCTDGGVLSDVLFIERRGIRFRHRVLAERVFESTRNYGLMADVARAIVRAISPVLSIEAIRTKSYAFRICKVLMERRSVYSTLGGNIDAAREWYASVEPDFGWNSRFWEQRALLELEADNYSAAYSYARSAADRESHAFPLTTLGTTCLIIAGYKSNSSLEEAFDLYKEGEAALAQALVVGRAQPDTLIRPIATYFTHTERLWPVFEKNGLMRQRLQSDWQRWTRDADSNGYFKIYPELEKEIRSWILKTSIKTA